MGIHISCDQGHGLLGRELFYCWEILSFDFSSVVLIYQKSALITSHMKTLNLTMQPWFVSMYSFQKTESNQFDYPENPHKKSVVILKNERQNLENLEYWDR